MNIAELQPKQGNVEIIGELTEKGDVREFEKFGKKGQVCNATMKDATGSIKLTLWNEQVTSVNAGDTIKIKNGWVSEWQGEKQLSTGKFGELEVVKAGGEAPVVTNDPKVLEETQKVPEEEFIDEDLE